jgi:hypothetical protein
MGIHGLKQGYIYLLPLTLLNLMKPVHTNLLMRPVNETFGGVGVFVFYVVHGCFVNDDFSYLQ